MMCATLEQKLCRFVTAAVFVVAAAGGLNAQQTGVVTGQVVNGRTLQPMAVVQVDIPDLQIGGLTQANGRFLLLNVPAGAYSLRVNRLGFRSITVQIQVTAGGTTEIAIDLTEEALALDAIVVTGNGRRHAPACDRELGGERKRDGIDCDSADLNVPGSARGP